jgi:hypothetical protein
MEEAARPFMTTFTIVDGPSDLTLFDAVNDR